MDKIASLEELFSLMPIGWSLCRSDRGIHSYVLRRPDGSAYCSGNNANELLANFNHPASAEMITQWIRK